MARQLSLLENRRTWALSETTREVGRRGVAEARASLQAALAARGGEGSPADRSAGRSVGRQVPADRRAPARRPAAAKRRPHAA